MSFNLDSINQASGFVRDIEKSMFQKLGNVSEKYSIVLRFAGLPIGMAKALLNIAERVAALGESLIKGMVNLFQGRTDLGKQQLKRAGWEVLGTLGSVVFGVCDVFASTLLFGLRPRPNEVVNILQYSASSHYWSSSYSASSLIRDLGLRN